MHSHSRHKAKSLHSQESFMIYYLDDSDSRYHLEHSHDGIYHVFLNEDILLPVKATMCRKFLTIHEPETGQREKHEWFSIDLLNDNFDRNSNFSDDNLEGENFSFCNFASDVNPTNNIEGIESPYGEHIRIA